MVVLFSIRNSRDPNRRQSRQVSDIKCLSHTKTLLLFYYCIILISFTDSCCSLAEALQILVRTYIKKKKKTQQVHSISVRCFQLFSWRKCRDVSLSTARGLVGIDTPTLNDEKACMVHQSSRWLVLARAVFSFVAGSAYYVDYRRPLPLGPPTNFHRSFFHAHPPLSRSPSRVRPHRQPIQAKGRYILFTLKSKCALCAHFLPLPFYLLFLVTDVQRCDSAHVYTPILLDGVISHSLLRGIPRGALRKLKLTLTHRFFFLASLQTTTTNRLPRELVKLNCLRV